MSASICSNPSLCQDSTFNEENVPLAFALSVGAGLATGIGAAVPLFPCVKMERTGFLSAGLGLSAGVMILVSLTELLSESQNYFCCVSQHHHAALSLLAFFGGAFCTWLLHVVGSAIGRSRWMAALTKWAVRKCSGRSWRGCWRKKSRAAASADGGSKSGGGVDGLAALQLAGAPHHHQVSASQDSVGSAGGSMTPVPLLAGQSSSHASSESGSSGSAAAAAATAAPTATATVSALEGRQRKTAVQKAKTGKGASRPAGTSPFDSTAEEGRSGQKGGERTALEKEDLATCGTYVAGISLADIADEDVEEEEEEGCREEEGEGQEAAAALSAASTGLQTSSPTAAVGTAGPTASDAAAAPPSSLPSGPTPQDEEAGLDEEEKEALRRKKQLLHDKEKLQRVGIMTGSVIFLHNLPEGLVSFIGALANPKLGAALAVAIALHVSRDEGVQLCSQSAPAFPVISCPVSTPLPSLPLSLPFPSPPPCAEHS